MRLGLLIRRMDFELDFVKETESGFFGAPPPLKKDGFGACI